MSFLEHLDELRRRLIHCLIAYAAVLAACWYFSPSIVTFLLRPVREHLFEGGDIVFINVTEPFFVYMKASALVALFVASPYILHELWAFVAPGLYRHERIMGLGFLLFGTFFFVAGGAFGYYVAVPVAAGWLIQLGHDFKASLTLRSAFGFESGILIGMGAVFELPILIFFLSRLGIVTPRFLLRHFRIAIVVIMVLAAVITPTGDALTMTIFSAPMIVLYLIGVAVAWIFGRKAEA